ncbi:MAG: V-type ATP synthase subunit D [Sphaerochaeta sp.]|nr:V-type ATP synthase subunit D [uncultured Sphaerochaeta sp.]MCK9347844.1 V-type ATP synthase subunit D [Sphaerochaeta sp.]MDD4301395.1 V-type ATP synthase subunit D [Sphaerochaeta sp.]MDY0243322.1 V-type ATP synthase subunit D [Sphaerochaeta sp.]
MAVKLTKNEQKLQKDRLKQYQRYLPTLQLKKQQLQMVIRQISAEVASLKKKQEALVQDMQTWIAVYHENTAFASELKVEKLIKIDKVVKAKGNIAGVTIPVFKELTFVPISYNLADYPLWVDKGLESLRDLARYDALIATLEQQVRLLEKELRTTSQRVNLFEKVKIPEAKDNIRRIAIYLGDQQTAAVVRGKIAKKKLMQGA